jgi:sterol desaturase/sphingolipid hydroxylase (fatty acid hydroxylase superfamily)
MFVCGDLGEFTSHIIQHKVKPLWEFHKVHHAATFLTPLTTFRSHPVSNLIDSVMMGLFTAIPAGIAAAFWHFSPHDRLLLAGAVNLALAIGLLGTLQHTHFPVSFGWLERWVVSPLMHQAHHSNRPEHFDRNFGTRFSIWDRCLGTAVMPRKDEKIRFGLNTQEDLRGDYAGVFWCYAGPFITCAKMLAAKIRGWANGRAAWPRMPVR